MASSDHIRSPAKNTDPAMVRSRINSRSSFYRSGSLVVPREGHNI